LAGKGILAVFRGRLNSVVSPVLVSMLAKITVSVRVPSRPLSASPPSSKTLSRGVLAQGSDACVWLGLGTLRVGRVALLLSLSLLNTLLMVLACT
jgi:hypothetical protein